LRKEDASIFYGEKEEDLPKGDYHTFFNWLGVGKKEKDD